MPGSLREITLEGRSFKAAADADGSTSYGGYDTEFSSNGDGATGRFIQTAAGWSLSGVDIAVEDGTDDLEFLTDFQTRAARVSGGTGLPIKAVYADGTVRSGGGGITGKIEVSSMSGTASLTFEGAGTFQKQ